MSKRDYVVRRVLQLVFTFWAFITILFFLFRIIPGDPTTMFVAQGVTGEARQRMLENMGLTDPLHVQYIKYMTNLLQGDLGVSFVYQEPVINVITVKFWNTIFLMGTGLVLAYAIGISVGAILAWYRGSSIEILGILVVLVLRSTPIFFIGIVLLLVFTFQLEWLPAAGMRSIGSEIDTFWDRYLAWDFVRHMILPVVSVALYYMTVPTLVMRNTMLEILNADFIETKKAEGLHPLRILYSHAVRNSLLPIITIAAISGGRAVGGQVVLEVLFNWPGMGREMVKAVYSNDFPTAQAAFFLMGVVVILLNFVADLMYGYLDPRVVYD